MSAFQTLQPAQRRDALASAMQRWGMLENPPPAAALVWVDRFVEAFGDELHNIDDARPILGELRAEACLVPALNLERLRTREVLFFLDSVGQYVDHQPELYGLPLDHDVPEIAKEFGLSPEDALGALRLALTGKRDGPPLDKLFPLLGHDRILIRIGAVNSQLLHGRGLEPIRYGPDGKPFERIQGSRPDGEQPTG